MRSSNAKPCAVVDTNLVVSGLLLKRGIPYELVLAILAERFTPVYSVPILEEYRDVLSRPRFAERYGLTSGDIAAFLTAIVTVGREVRPRRRLPVAVRDPKDEMILAAALGGKADYLVSGDQDLLTLASDPALSRLQVVTARTFLDELTEWEARQQTE